MCRGGGREKRGGERGKEVRIEGEKGEGAQCSDGKSLEKSNSGVANLNEQ